MNSLSYQGIEIKTVDDLYKALHIAAMNTMLEGTEHKHSMAAFIQSVEAFNAGLGYPAETTYVAIAVALHQCDDECKSIMYTLLPAQYDDARRKLEARGAMEILARNTVTPSVGRNEPVH